MPAAPARSAFGGLGTRLRAAGRTIGISLRALVLVGGRLVWQRRGGVLRIADGHRAEKHRARQKCRNRISFVLRVVSLLPSGQLIASGGGSEPPVFARRRLAQQSFHPRTEPAPNHHVQPRGRGRSSEDAMKKLIGFLVLALVVVVAAIGAALFFGVESAKLAETASFGPSPTLPEPSKVPIPTVNIAPAKGWPEGAKPTARQRACGQCLRQRARSSALALRAAQRRRAGRGNERAAAAGGCKRHQGLGLSSRRRSGRAPACRAPTASRSCATPTATASRTKHGVPRRPQFAVRHGARRQRSLRRQHRRDLALSLYGRRDPRSARRARRSPICRPGRSTIIGPRT